MTDAPQRLVRRRSPDRASGARRRRLTDSSALIEAAGTLGYAYLSLVRATSTMIFEPANLAEAFRATTPLIATMWHGHHFIMPLIRPREVPVRVLISKHRDGAIDAAIVRRFGMEAVRGSGGRNPRQAILKGAISGLLKLKSSLESGWTVAMTADISKGVSRSAGLGIVTLARLSGRPIVCFGLAASRRIRIDSWDRMELALPFSRLACVAAPVIDVPGDASDAALEDKRREVEHALNAATDRAYEIVGRGRR